MLRVNLMEDPGFRTDLIKMIGGVLREVATDAIRQKLNEDGWLQRRMDALLEKEPVASLIAQVLRQQQWWENGTVKRYLTDLVDTRVKEARETLQRQLDAKFDSALRDAVGKIIADELRARLASTVR